VNKHRLKEFAAPFCIAFLVVLLALPGVSMGSSKLTFAFSERSPPYSSTLREEAVGLFPDLVRLTFSFVPD
jgi:polar amino acid transport system substrate-binding protein